MEYDLEYELVNELYDKFVVSEYNNGRIGLYECIVNYLKNEGGNQ